jgi:uncharacterized protein (DUF983 family)
MFRPNTESEAHPPRAWTYIGRALRLRCPECGVSPVFTPWRRVRSLYDWLTPLDGCARCGFAYIREAGYFMLAIGGVNYGLIAGLGLLISLMFEWLHPLPLWKYMVFILAPMPLLSLLMARHAKALYMAIDHYLDPQGRGRGPRAN